MGKAVQWLLVLCLIFTLHSTQQVAVANSLSPVRSGVLQNDCETKYAHRLATSPDGKLIAVNWYRGSDPGQITIWDVQTGKSVDSFNLGDDGITIDLEFSSDSRLLALADYDSVIVRDVTEAKTVLRTGWDVEETEIGDGIRISPNSELLLMYGTSGGRLLNIKTGKLVHKIPLYFSSDNMYFSPDGKSLLAEGSSFDEPVTDWTLSVWDVKTGQKTHVFEDGFEGIFSPDGKYILSSRLNLWDAKTYKLIQQFVHSENTRLSPAGYFFKFSLDGRYLAINTIVDNSGKSRGVLEVWDLKTFKIKHKLEVDENIKVGEHHFLPNSQYVITSEVGSSGYNVLRLWDVSTGRQISVNENLPYIRNFSPLPDNKHIVIFPGEEGIVELWDVFTGKKVRSYC